MIKKANFDSKDKQSWDEFFSHDTFRRRKFCLEFIKDFNGTRAAERAGFSKKTSGYKSVSLLKEPKVQETIRGLIKDQEIRLGITADKILALSYEIASADIIGCFDEHGALKKVEDIPEALRRTISSIDIDEIWEHEGREKIQIGVTKKIKFWNKDKQIEFLGKHLKLVADMPDEKPPLDVNLNVTVKHIDIEERLNCLTPSRN